MLEEWIDPICFIVSHTIIAQLLHYILRKNYKFLTVDSLGGTLIIHFVIFCILSTLLFVVLWNFVYFVLTRLYKHESFAFREARDRLIMSVMYCIFAYVIMLFMIIYLYFVHISWLMKLFLCIHPLEYAFRDESMDVEDMDKDEQLEVELQKLCKGDTFNIPSQSKEELDDEEKRDTRLRLNGYILHRTLYYPIMSAFSIGFYFIVPRVEDMQLKKDKI